MRLFNGVRVVDGPCPENVSRLDHAALPMIVEMAKTGLQVDLSHFAKLDKTLTEDMDRVSEEVHQMTGHYANLGSGDQVADLLFRKLGLKQAHPKFTSSGDRESVEDAVLVAIQHDHPVVPKCLEYKELEKLRGTYTRPMPKLARKTKFGTYRIYPNFKTTRVPSGRLSCTDPNLLAIPTRTSRGSDIRKGFITDDGWVFLSVDECVTYDTTIVTLGGDKRVSDIIPGMLVLGTDTKRWTASTPTRNTWQTVTKSKPMGRKECMRVVFDTNVGFGPGWCDCSIDHKWPVLLSDGTTAKVLTDNLETGMRVPNRNGGCNSITALYRLGRLPVWGLTVKPSHCYFIGCGVLTCNSQIEMRMAAHISGDSNLIRIYQQKEDIYSDFATTAFRLQDKRYKDADGWHYPTIDKMQHRYPAKTCVLASMYRVTASGLLDQMPVICAACSLPADKHTCRHFSPLWTEDLCQGLINSFYMRYAGLSRMQKEDDARLRKHGLTWDMWGRILHGAAVRSVHEHIANKALREAGNFPLQSGAQGTVKLTMGALFQDMTVNKMFDVAHPLLTVHDEIIYEVREDIAEELQELTKWRFKTCVQLKIPIEASGCTALTWGDLKK